MTQPTAAAGEDPTAQEGPDVRSAVVTGVTTALWYAVPDVVGPRWARALAKTAVLGVGVGVGVAVTSEGRAALAGVRAAGAPDAEPDDVLDSDPDDDLDDASAADEPAVDRGDGAAPVNPVVAAGGIAAALGAVTALAVLGEKWAYRVGERRRAKGRRLPHTGVGLVVGALAAGLTLLEPRAEGLRADRSPGA